MVGKGFLAIEDLGKYTVPMAPKGAPSSFLQIFGIARFLGGPPLERKIAGILAYLALEGPSSRQKIAGMFWPKVEDEKARRNLRQTVHRLRENYPEVVNSDDIMAINETVTPLISEEDAESGPLLQGLDFFDCDEFLEWLESTRARFEGRKREKLNGQANNFEESGLYAEAIQVSKRLLELDPISEEIHRRLMRLYYLTGDRPSAIAVFEQLEEKLKHELGVSPLPETIELSRVIEHGSVIPGATKRADKIPISVLRPPVLVGRENEWAQLESAWESGLAIAIIGAPGMGKTRLLHDFLQSKGKYDLLEGRPGDSSVPFAPYARSLRRIFNDDKNFHISESERTELARIVPELWPKNPPPIKTQQEKIQFFETVSAVLERLGEGELQVLAVDDLQYFDPASFELVNFSFTRNFGKQSRLVGSYRSGELNPEIKMVLDQAFDSGMIVQVELEALSPEKISELLQSLESPELHQQELSQSISRYTGGNPMFVLETLKELYKNQKVGQKFPDKMPPPGKIEPLIARRLDRLSPLALKLARVAAIAGEDFSPNLASKILHINPVELTEPWLELESSQVLTENRFAHDLIYEATLSGIPSVMKGLLHRETALHLAPEQAAPHLWLAIQPGHADSSELNRTLEIFIKAGKNHFYKGSYETGLEWYNRAIGLASSASEKINAQISKARTLERHMQFKSSADTLAEIEPTLEDPSVSPILKAKFWNTKATLLNIGFKELSEAGALAQRALRLVINFDDFDSLAERADAIARLGQIAFDSREFDSAKNFHLEALTLRKTLGDKERIAESMVTLANAIAYLRQDGWKTYLEEALAISKQQRLDILAVRILNNLGQFSWQSGELDQAEKYLSQALQHSHDSGRPLATMQILNNLGAVQFLQQKFELAIQTYQQALENTEVQDPIDKGMVLGNIAEAYLRLNQPARAKDSALEGLKILTDSSRVTDQPELCIYLAEAEILVGDTSAAEKALKRSLEWATQADISEKIATAMARLARLKGDKKLAKKSLELYENPTTQSANLLGKGRLEEANKVIQQLGDKYEEDRLRSDALNF